MKDKTYCRKRYVQPDVSIVNIDAENVICTSGDVELNAGDFFSVHYIDRITSVD
ncbi:MAG: hypothetical protein ACI4QZ_06345 [Eubacteriales bacterium]